MPDLNENLNEFSEGDLRKITESYVQNPFFRIQHDVSKPPLLPSEFNEVMKIVQENYSSKYGF
ncbi:MAG: hypothetical protein KJ949_00015 [Nanoarchaeota archaeon]|nr:hypothetical protein [Nanoarchaeota archaeon]MBU4308622.1 hypothetical protein [Nanoarchaeota archaeon]